MSTDSSSSVHLRAADALVTFKDAVALDLREADFFGTTPTVLLGPNGAGKTTLIQLLATLSPSRRSRQSGHLTLDGVDISESLRSYRRQLGWLPQRCTFPKQASVYRYVEHVAWLKEIPRGLRPKRVMKALATVGLEHHANDAIGTLSGGMQQRVGLAQALVNLPAVLLLDEPTVGLDPIERRAFCKLLANLSPSSIVVLATHLIEDVADIGGRVLVLNRGALIFDGTVSELCQGKDKEDTVTNFGESAKGTLVSALRSDVETLQQSYAALLS